MLTTNKTESTEADAFLALTRAHPAAPSPLRPACTSLALQGVLDCLDVGVLICDGQGRLLHANATARAELCRRGALRLLDAGTLEVSTSSDAQALQRAVRAAVMGQRHQMLALRHERQVLMVSVQPIRAPDQPAPCALLLLGRRRCADLAVQELGRLFKLTQAEQEILKGLLGGVRVSELARTRGVMLSTVRTQVSSLRAKFGARRLEDITRLASELPPMLGAVPALQAVMG